MVQNSILQLVPVDGLMLWADKISGIFLIILAVVVLFEFVKMSQKKELVKERSLIAIVTMGTFLTVQFFIGRIGIGRFDWGLSITDAFVIVGCTTVVLGVVLNLIARIQLGANWSNNIVIYREQVLVTKGLYGVVRHPLYTTIFLISIGLAIQYVNYFSLIIAVFLFLPMLYSRMAKEEKVLEKHLEGYTGYEKSVPMFFPFPLNKFFSVHDVQVNSWALRLCRATTVVFLLAALYFQSFWFVILVFILMASSTVFSISRSPLIVLYTRILTRFGVKKEEIIDVNAIRFAQGLGSVLLLCAMLLLYAFHHPFGGWVLVSIVAFSTAFGSLGYCLGAYIYFLVRKIYNSHA